MTTHPTRGIPYTPGPWSVDTCDTDLVTADSDGLVTCWTSNADRDQEAEGTVEANARLIAAAPTLLKTLDEILPDFEAYVDAEQDEEIAERNRAWIAQARADIAKAKGE